MMKKILFYIHSLNKGGAEHVLLTVAEELNKDPDYSVVILTDTVDELEYELSSDIKRVILDAEFGSDLSPVKRLGTLRKCILREAPDKIVVFMLSSVIRAAVALTGTRHKIIGAVRSNPYDDYSTGRNRALLMWSMRKCEKMVCQTQYQAEFFPERVRDRCIVISNPIFREFEKKAAELSGQKVTGNRIVATGRLFDYKNHKLLIRAFAKVADSFPDVTVTIYGEGPYREETEAEIAGSGIKNRVFLPGDSSKVAEDIADALIYVLPSDTEGLPNALMEAMALGLPVISTDCPCGGPKSLIEDGVNGILTPVRDIDAMAAALKRLLQDPELRDKLGRNAGKIRQTNSIDKITDCWKELLR